MSRTVSANVFPPSTMDVLSNEEISRISDASRGLLHALLRRCALAVLATGTVVDDAEDLLARYPDFDIEARPQPRGIELVLTHAPSDAFVDGKLIRGAAELLFSVVRDVLQVDAWRSSDGDPEGGMTQVVFEQLRRAQILKPAVEPNLVVCWGGHSISQTEYLYTKEVGYELGLRGLDICTGCGPGAMKGPMKGATIAHAKQRRSVGRYIGLTEPGIIAAESPNPIVNRLIVLPDIEKRLEAFVRIGHGFIVFPGGVGTAEEILYLLGILLHPDNQELPFPLVFTGPSTSAAYFEQIDAFLRFCLGDAVAQRYRIVIDDPVEVARTLVEGISQVRAHRVAQQDAFCFNWSIRIEPEFQAPFSPSHEAMAALRLHRDQAPHLLAAALRRAFSGIVAGNVKAEGMRAIADLGPFLLDGDPLLMKSLDELLTAFVEQGRMKLPGKAYEPCYRVQVRG